MNARVDNDHLRVLLIHDNKNESNRLISMLRNANYKPNAKHADQEDVLVKLLQERPWDIVICQMDSEKLSPKSVFSNIRRQNLDLPVVLVTEEYNPVKVVEGLRIGSSDVVAMDHDQHLLQVVSRTLYNLNNRRKSRSWKRKYFDSEKRAERLLHNSRDAIAIIQEGTYLYANDSYAHMLEYADGDSMVCLPVIDTIANGHQASLKPYLREVADTDSYENKEIAYTAVTMTDAPISVHAVVSQIEFEGEPALEFLIPENQLHNSHDISQSASYIILNRMYESISGAIRKAAQHVSKAVLLYIEVDDFCVTQKELGFEKMEQLLTELSDSLDIESGSRHVLHRYKEHNYVLLMQNTSADAGLRFAKNLCKTIADKSIELDGSNYSLTLSIGASVISDAVTTVEGCIDRSLDAMNVARGESPEGDHAALYELDYDNAETDLEDIETLTLEYLEKKYFLLSFQPIITLHGEPNKFYEVLLQVAPQGNPKNLPTDFIAQIFNTQAAAKLDRWVIMEAVKVLAKTLAKEPQTKLFVNISATTMCDDEFIPWLKVVLKASGVPTSQLVFQLREIDVARYQNRAVEMVKLFASIDSQVALSRFGLAIEPMKLIKQLDADYVKFDSQLVKAGMQGCVSDEVEQLINALKEENQNIIVPFVESAQMIPGLWQMGIHYIQGHFLQAPAPEMDFDFDADN